MRRNPRASIDPSRLPDGLMPTGAAKPPSTINVQTQSALIEPFLVSGGQGYFDFLDIGGQDADPGPAGTQLICSVYVPKGRVGFIKEVRCAPFIQPLLVDPWLTTGANGASWREFNDVNGYAIFEDLPYRPAAQKGLWETPFAWESYAPFVATEGDKPRAPGTQPRWSWQIRFLQGGVDQLRQTGTNIPASSPTYEVDGEGNVVLTGSSEQFFMLPSIAVPTPLVYPGSVLPGTACGPNFGAQRVQQLPSDPLHTHILIPENTSACLFAQWTQGALSSVYARDANGIITIIDMPTGDDAIPIYPLLPSFGSLHGYMQSSLAAQTLQNAQLGWGG